MVASKFAEPPKPQPPGPDVAWLLAYEAKLWAEGLPDALAFVSHADLAHRPVLLICAAREHAARAAKFLGITAKPLPLHPQVLGGVLMGVLGRGETRVMRYQPDDAEKMFALADITELLREIDAPARRELDKRMGGER
jgi:hypothetical protein